MRLVLTSGVAAILALVQYAARPTAARGEEEAVVMPLAVDGGASPTATASVHSGSGPTLLQIWSPEELAGRPGDERTVSVRPADRRPPVEATLDQRPEPVDEAMRNSLRRVRLPPGEKFVALTFDLCEQASKRAGYDRGIVNYLRAEGVAATFFAGGKWMRTHEDKTMQLMADPRFEVGNHAWTHGNLRLLHGQAMLDQLVWTQAEYARIRRRLQDEADRLGLGELMTRVPRLPTVFRFPYGTCDAAALRAVNDLGMRAIQWDVVSGDPVASLAPEVLAREVLTRVRPGSIIVFHANGRGKATARALPAIVTALRARGFDFRTVSDLLRQGTPESAAECYELKPGDNRAIDAKYGQGTG